MSPNKEEIDKLVSCGSKFNSCFCCCCHLCHFCLTTIILTEPLNVTYKVDCCVWSSLTIWFFTINKSDRCDIYKMLFLEISTIQNLKVMVISSDQPLLESVFLINIQYLQNQRVKLHLEICQICQIWQICLSFYNSSGI